MGGFGGGAGGSGGTGCGAGEAATGEGGGLGLGERLGEGGEMENWTPLPKGFPQYNKLGSVRHVCDLQGLSRL